MDSSASKGLLAGIPIEILRERIGRPPYRELWETMVERLGEIIAWEANNDEFWTIGACGGRHVAPFVLEAALVHRLRGDEDALAHYLRQIDKMAGLYIHDPDSRQRLLGRFRADWSHAYISLAYDMCRESTDEARRQLLMQMARETFFTLAFKNPRARFNYLAGHNIPFVDHLCCAISALVLGEEAGCDHWEDTVNAGRDYCIAYCRFGLDAGGYPYEGTMYVQPALYLVYLFAELLYRNGREDLFADEPVLAAVPDAALSLLFPDRSALVSIADGGVGSPKSFPWLLLTARHYGRPQDLGFWYEFRGPGCKHPPCEENNPPVTADKHGGDRPPVRRDLYGHQLFPLLWWDDAADRVPVADSALPLANYSPGTETANFRTSWGEDAVYVNVLGQGRSHCSLDHVHSDCGHFTISAYGEYLAIDPGYWNVNESQHSVVLVDGQDRPSPVGNETYRKHLAGRLKGFQRHALLDYVAADSAQPKNGVWSDRHVLFVRVKDDECYVVTLDNINPDDKVHSFVWQLQANPDSTVSVEDDGHATIRLPNARLDVSFLSPLAGDFPACPHELSVAQDHVYGAYVQGEADALKGAVGVKRDFIYTREEARREKSDLQYSSFYRPRLLAEQKGPNCLLMAVIVPRRAGAAEFPVRDLSGPRTFRAEVDCGDFTDTILAALDHSIVQFDDISGYTELALIRRDKTGTLIDYWTVRGESLEIRP